MRLGLGPSLTFKVRSLGAPVELFSIHYFTILYTETEFCIQNVNMGAFVLVYNWYTSIQSMKHDT